MHVLLLKQTQVFSGSQKCPSLMVFYFSVIETLVSIIMHSEISCYKEQRINQ